jgi:hypothetical protein
MIEETTLERKRRLNTERVRRYRARKKAMEEPVHEEDYTQDADSDDSTGLPWPVMVLAVMAVCGLVAISLWVAKTQKQSA